MADQRRAVAKTALDHAISQFDRGVQVVRIVKSVEPKVRPLVRWRQIVARERINVSGGTEHWFVPPSFAPANRSAIECASKPSPRRAVNPFDAPPPLEAIGTAPQIADRLKGRGRGRGAGECTMRILHRLMQARPSKRKQIIAKLLSFTSVYFS
jgi:hypothetical protein